MRKSINGWMLAEMLAQVNRTGQPVNKAFEWIELDNQQRGEGLADELPRNGWGISVAFLFSCGICQWWQWWIMTRHHCGLLTTLEKQVKNGFRLTQPRPLPSRVNGGPRWGPLYFVTILKTDNKPPIYFFFSFYFHWLVIAKCNN